MRSLFLQFNSKLCGTANLNTTLLKIITDDKLSRPELDSFNTQLDFVVGRGVFADILVGLVLSIVFILFNLISFLILFYLVKKRDFKAVILGEKLLAEFQTIDLQICYILSEIWNNSNSDLEKPIRRT